MRSASLEQRLDELEARFAFQEQALLELSDALAQARLERLRTDEVLSRLLEELRQIRGQIAPLALLDLASEVPPHY